ncbi:MAG: fumarate hydratase [Patescibacteria group bacterium]
MNNKQLENQIVQLYKDTACGIPFDIGEALIKARNKENKGSRPYEIFSVILENLRLAQEKGKPMCQDTGTPVFYVKFGKNNYDKKVIDIINLATDRATKQVPLRENSVRISDNKNIGTNIPEIHIDFWDKPDTEINLMLKGGGSENVSQIIKMTGPDRNENGIIKAALQTVFEAQGKGCSPGILGIAVSGTMAGAIENSKIQLLRKVGERSKNKQTASLEKKILERCNELEIGPLGLGGKTTILDVFISDLSKSFRHPASFYVAVCYMCYADRRRKLGEKVAKVKFPEYKPDYSKYKKVNAPIRKNYNLKAGDRILLDGMITTARDRAHEYLLKEKKKIDISNVIYHCGILAGNCQDCLVSAGPTTSLRMDDYQAQVVKKYNIKAIIGKGGMNNIGKGAVYLEGLGGVGVIPARLMKIKNGYKKDFGIPEAIWNLKVGEPGMPLWVTIDAQGNNLYEQVENKSEKIYNRLIKELN